MKKLAHFMALMFMLPFLGIGIAAGMARIAFKIGIEVADEMVDWFYQK